MIAELAGVVHGGTLTAFAVLLLGRSWSPRLEPAVLVRVFQATGALLGLTLGVYLLAEAWAWPAAVNPGATGIERWAVPADRRGLRVAVLFAYWVSYVVLEVYTLEPFRTLEREHATNPAAWARAVAGVARHVGVNAALFMGQLVLAG